MGLASINIEKLIKEFIMQQNWLFVQIYGLEITLFLNLPKKSAGNWKTKCSNSITHTISLYRNVQVYLIIRNNNLFISKNAIKYNFVCVLIEILKTFPNLGLFHRNVIFLVLFDRICRIMTPKHLNSGDKTLK